MLKRLETDPLDELTGAETVGPLDEAHLDKSIQNLVQHLVVIVESL